MTDLRAEGQRYVLSRPPRLLAPSFLVTGVAASADARQRRVWLTSLIGVPFWIAIGLRLAGDIGPVENTSSRLAIGILLIAALLFLITPAVSSRYSRYLPLSFALQTGLILSLYVILNNPDLDYFAVLYIPLSALAVVTQPPPLRVRWTGLFTLAMIVGLVYAMGLPDALPLILLYAAANAFAASYAALVEKAETEREQSRRLFAELQTAYQRLETYAAQAEALAAAEARTQIARDLHDSVTQTLFGLSLSAEAAARTLAQGHAVLAAKQIQDVQETARQVLAELRLLVFELRPARLAQDGLATSLQARLQAVEARAGLTTDLVIEGDDRLPPTIEVELDRIAQEALNNALKHAHARRIEVHLRQLDAQTSLSIGDDGVGFTPDGTQPSGGLGLRGMAERAAQLGGHLAIVSQPGAGTRVEVTVPR